MADSALTQRGRLFIACCVVGILPLPMVYGADLLFGPWDGDTDSVYVLQALSGPPLLALLFVPRWGPRAGRVAAGGVLCAFVVLLVLYGTLALLLSAGES